MITWRWDQGRLDYFYFENIRAIAKCLSDLNGLNLKGDVLRGPLQLQTGLPFAPDSSAYPVLRNYKRVFGCSLLATSLNSTLVVTDLCRKVAGDGATPITADEYFSFIIPRFYFPSPVFDGYRVDVDQIFPFCAILKLLLSRYGKTTETKISLQEIFSLLVGNQVTGAEPLEDFIKLMPTKYLPAGDQTRQVREMMIFASQFSFLKWHKDSLYLDLPIGGGEAPFSFLSDLSIPVVRKREINREQELLSIGIYRDTHQPTISSFYGYSDSDIVFSEGKRNRVLHVRIERSPKLRKLFLKSLTPPILCDACNLNSKMIYSWTDSILDVHHLLPLGSSVSVNRGGVSFSDLVPICANCHRGIHSYYKLWLDKNSSDDFRSKNEAVLAYNEAKSRIQDNPRKM